jgi:hypothetical protein
MKSGTLTTHCAAELQQPAVNWQFTLCSLLSGACTLCMPCQHQQQLVIITSHQADDSVSHMNVGSVIAHDTQQQVVKGRMCAIMAPSWGYMDCPDCTDLLLVLAQLSTHKLTNFL